MSNSIGGTTQLAAITLTQQNVWCEVTAAMRCFHQGESIVGIIHHGNDG